MARPDDLHLDAIAGLSVRPDFTFRYVLDGEQHSMRLVYYERPQCWYLDFITDTGASIVQGLQVAEGRDIVAPYHAYQVPRGQLFVVDTTGLGRAPDRFAWQSWARIYYRSVAVMALAAGSQDEVW